MIKSASVPVEIHNLTDFMKNSGSAIAFQKTYDAKCFSACGNFMRREIIHTFGGIYFDMGFRRAEKNLKNILENLAKQQPNEKPES